MQVPINQSNNINSNLGYAYATPTTTFQSPTTINTTSYIPPTTGVAYQPPPTTSNIPPTTVATSNTPTTSSSSTTWILVAITVLVIALAIAGLIIWFNGTAGGGTTTTFAPITPVTTGPNIHLVSRSTGLALGATSGTTTTGLATGIIRVVPVHPSSANAIIFNADYSDPRGVIFNTSGGRVLGGGGTINGITGGVFIADKSVFQDPATTYIWDVQPNGEIHSATHQDQVLLANATVTIPPLGTSHTSYQWSEIIV